MLRPVLPFGIPVSDEWLLARNEVFPCPGSYLGCDMSLKLERKYVTH